jgi:hypothetical protein
MEFTPLNELKPLFFFHYFTGNPYLSGSAACHWYFNHDIPEAAKYYTR